MDITNELAAQSDRLNAVDLTGGERTVTILEITKDKEGRVSIVTDVFGPERPFKPSKTVLRILAEAWKRETANWVGRSMTIYRDPNVRWAGQPVGGIRVSALSHIDKTIELVLPESNKTRAKSTIVPLATSPARDWPAAIKAAEGNVDALLALHKTAKQENAGDTVLNAITVAGKRAKEAGA